ncbi:MAG: thiolase domain-containing protein [Anaerolineae bacterium]|nr:thiolase domain-containing protein [Anaerolineae bacterium]
MRTAYLAVASGAVETAMVVGVEKSTDRVGGSRTLARNVSLDADYEVAHGVTLTALAAMLMRRYMHEYGLDLSAFEGFTINAHANGTRNPNAMFRNAIKSGRFAKAPMISDPVSLFDSAPDADGAAAVILTSLERAADLVPRPIQITGSAVATDTIALHDRGEPLFFRSAHTSASRALSQAGLQRADIDLFELHDAYTIMSALTLEATGFAAQGHGWELANSNAIALNGSLPITTFGGLKARGNPAGATGVYQVVEASLQLQQAAGDNQVVGAEYAMVQNLGGLAATAVTHILSSV